MFRSLLSFFFDVKVDEVIRLRPLKKCSSHIQKRLEESLQQDRDGLKWFASSGIKVGSPVVPVLKDIDIDVFVVLMKHDPVGFICHNFGASKEVGVGYWIALPFRRKGITRKVLSTVSRMIKKMDPNKTVTLRIQRKNLPSRRLAENLGFVVVRELETNGVSYLVYAQ
jgi:hypothetical protein